MRHTKDMKKPQLEDGYTRIANELFEAVLGFGFSQRQLLVLLTILRKTYGYGKKEDDMSASQIGEICSVSRNHVTEVVGQLAKMGVLTKRQGSYGMLLGVNKNYSTWTKESAPTSPNLGLVPNQDSPNLGLAKVVPIRDSGSPNLGQVDSPNSGHTKENLSKENQQKKGGGKKPRPSLPEINFVEWMEKCKGEGRMPIPEDDPVFGYARDVDLPIDYVRYAWIEFKRKYGASKKKYKNWNQHFGNAVRENWYGVWFDKDGAWQLTTRGKQVQRELSKK